jgi:endonuclease YncB( thermonuclease family)
LVSAYHYAKSTQAAPIVVTGTSDVKTADGDSFIISGKKFRLKGIDAPEYTQNCNDASGKPWPCGKASHLSLINLLKHSGLSCAFENHDRFNRALAVCSTAQNRDIAAVQVRAGLAISNKFNGLRDYADEEDDARKSKRGVWQGSFIHPKDWRAINTRQPPPQ